jgi:hypothetical protein
MTQRAGAWLAWSLWAIFVLLAAGQSALIFMTNSSAAFVSVIAALELVSFPTVGALVAARRPRNPIGWLILAIALSFVLGAFTYEYAVYTLVSRPGALPGGLALAWLSTWIGLPGSALLLTFFLLLFPTGHLPSPRWRSLAWFAGGLMVTGMIAAAVTPGGVNSPDSPIRNPLGLTGAVAFLNLLQGALQLLATATAVLCATSIVLRFRHARGQERQQLKWFAYAILFLVLFFVANNLGTLNPAFNRFLAGPAGDLLFGLAVSLPAVAIGIAILKYRLYDIDLLIRRTLIYGVLTALLAVVYFGVVVALQAIFTALTGSARSELVTVLSTLVIAALFVPLRSRLQAVIDRRFYRRKYDAARTLAVFGAGLRDEVDLANLSAHLLAAVDETMQPAAVSLWLRSTLGERQTK